MGGQPLSNISLRISLNGSLSFLVNWMKGNWRSSEGKSTMFFIPFNGPSTPGNGMTEMEIYGALETLEWIPRKYAGVVEMVTMMPHRARRWERSSIRKVWPCAMKGKITIWRGGVVDPIVDGGCGYQAQSQLYYSLGLNTFNP